MLVRRTPISDLVGKHPVERSPSRHGESTAPSDGGSLADGYVTNGSLRQPTSSKLGADRRARRNVGLPTHRVHPSATDHRPALDRRKVPVRGTADCSRSTLRMVVRHFGGSYVQPDATLTVVGDGPALIRRAGRRRRPWRARADARDAGGRSLDVAYAGNDILVIRPSTRSGVSSLTRRSRPGSSSSPRIKSVPHSTYGCGVGPWSGPVTSAQRCDDQLAAVRP